MRYQLTALDSAGTEAYVNHRLRVAGSHDSLFKPSTFPVISHYSHGIPRLINTLCDNALLEGFLRKRERIEAELIHEVAKDLKLAP